jgi:hypothetical protein
MEGHAPVFFAYGITFLSFLSLVYAVAGLCFTGAYVSEQATDAHAVMIEGLADDMSAYSLAAALTLLSLGVLANAVQCIALMARAFGPEHLKVSVQRKSAVMACGAAMLLFYPVLFYLDLFGLIEVDGDDKLTNSAAFFLMACCVSICTFAAGTKIETYVPRTPSPRGPTLLQGMRLVSGEKKMAMSSSNS